MKRFGVAAGVAAIAAWAPAALAGVVVGSMDSGNCYPFNCNDSGTAVGRSIDFQEVYNAAAFGGPLKIATLTFYRFPYGPGPVLNGHYDITLGTTTAPVGAGYPVTPLANVQTFFDGVLGGPVSGRFVIFGNAYAYDPSQGNLVMEVVASNQDAVPNTGSNGYFWADYTAVDVSRAYLVTGGVPLNDPGALVTGFNDVPEPATWLLMLGGLGALGSTLRARREAARGELA